MLPPALRRPARLVLVFGTVMMLLLAGTGSASAGGLGRPDAQIRRVGQPTFVGNDVYSATAVGETLQATAPKGVTRRYDIRIENEGAEQSNFDLTAIGATSPYFTVQYFDGTMNITTPVNQGIVFAIGANDTFDFQMRITTKNNAPRNATVARRLRFKNADTGQVDAVKVVVTRP